MSSDQPSQHPLDQKTALAVDDLSHRVPIVRPRETAGNEYSDQNESMRGHQSAYQDNPLRFADRGKKPNFAVVEEKPEHRILMYMIASGKSNQEAAALMGYGVQWVYQIRRQPWFKERIAEVLHEEGKNLVENFLQGEVLTSIETLVDIRNDEAQKGSTRVAAANAILDRALGKPIQSIKSEVTHIPAGEVSEENTRLDRELASLQEQLKLQNAAN